MNRNKATTGTSRKRILHALPRILLISQCPVNKGSLPSIPCVQNKLACNAFEQLSRLRQQGHQSVFFMPSQVVSEYPPAGTFVAAELSDLGSYGDDIRV